jgi:hypothetical protein
MKIYTKQPIHLNRTLFSHDETKFHLNRTLFSHDETKFHLNRTLFSHDETKFHLNRTLFGHDETKFHLNSLQNYKKEKHIEIFSLEGFFLIDKNVIYKLNVIDVEPIIMDEFILDLSSETREIVYQIPNIHIVVDTLTFSVLINKKLGLSFVFEEKYDKNDKIGENYYFLAEKFDEPIKMCIYEFLSSLH